MKEVLKTIIRSFHTGKLPKVIERDVRLPMNSGKVVSVVGPRRAGKTYLLFYQIISLIKKGVPLERILYINFEDERIELNQRSLDLVIQAYRELYPEFKLEECYFFFDEIQNVEGWEKFVRRVYDTITKNIFLTGSNSKLLGYEIATSLRGRTIRFELFPLNFREFLRFKGFEFDKHRDFYSPEKKAKLVKLFEEYMLFGGFPEVVFLDESIKVKTLQEYFEVMLYRDIVERYSVKDVKVLKYFLKRLAESAGRFFSVNRIYNELKSMGFRIGKDTLYSYLEYAEASYVVKLLKKHYRSVAKAEIGEKKVYLIDTGILNSIRLFEKQSYGVLLENLIFREFLPFVKSMTVFKERKECDFVLDDKVALQVCFDPTDSITLHREIEGLKEACQYFGLKVGYIISYDTKEEIIKNHLKIYILPAYEVLLEPETIFSLL